MGKRRREKGKRGEREAAKLISELFGVKFIRGVQHQGGKDSPDIKPDGDVEIGIHFEIKRDEMTIADRVSRDITRIDGPLSAAYNNREVICLPREFITRPPETVKQDSPVKLTKSLIMALDQSKRDASGEKIPVVLSKRNRKKWYLFVETAYYEQYKKEIGRIMK